MSSPPKHTICRGVFRDITKDTGSAKSARLAYIVILYGCGLDPSPPSLGVPASLRAHDFDFAFVLMPHQQRKGRKVNNERGV